MLRRHDSIELLLPSYVEPARGIPVLRGRSLSDLNRIAALKDLGFTLTGRTLRVEFEGWVDSDVTARDGDALGRHVADLIAVQLREAGNLTWTTRAAP